MSSLTTCPSGAYSFSLTDTMMPPKTLCSMSWILLSYLIILSWVQGKVALHLALGSL